MDPVTKEITEHYYKYAEDPLVKTEVDEHNKSYKLGDPTNPTNI